MAKRPKLPKFVSGRAANAARKVLRNPESSKAAHLKRGQALTQRRK